MTHEQHRRMQLAAREIMRLQARGHDIDPLAVQWAQSLQHTRLSPPPPQKAYQADKVYEALMGHPPGGLLASEIRERAGLSASICATTLCYMAQREQVHMLKIAGRSRYFLTKAALEKGRPVVEEQERARAASKVKPKRPPKPPKPPKPRPLASRPMYVRSSKVVRLKKFEGVMPREQGVLDTTNLPVGVHVTRGPGPRDRFEVTPPIVGIGAVEDWQKRTRKRRSRK